MLRVTNVPTIPDAGRIRVEPSMPDTRGPRASVLDRRADLLLTAGLHLVAERLAHAAAALRDARP